MRSTDSLLDFAREVAAASAGTAPVLISDYLGARIGADDVFHIDGDASIGAFRAWRASAATRDSDIEAAMPAFDQHPGVRSYLDRPNDLTPRRVSELPQARDPLLSDALHLSQPLLGKDQLSILQSVTVERSWRGSGWVIGRAGSDFTDAAVETARQVAPVLMIAHRLHFAALSLDSPGSWAELTGREQQVLRLLRTGMTAKAIGVWMGISPRTVSKHLENAYRKLQVHDRLSAVRTDSSGGEDE